VSVGVSAEMPALSASALDDYDPFCAQCGTELEDDQEWCLECGAARTLIHTAPDWRVPVAIVAAVIVAVLAALVVALVNVSQRANASAARASATRLAGGGLGVGVLNSSQHPNLPPGNWVVFTGRYPLGTEAAAAAARLRASGHPNARARQVARPGGL
jgi:hypothetical protein